MTYTDENAKAALVSLVESQGGKISFEESLHWDYDFTDDGLELDVRVKSISLEDGVLYGECISFAAEADEPEGCKPYMEPLRLSSNFRKFMNNLPNKLKIKYQL